MAYKITVTRNEKKGKLTYSNGTISVDTTCWWDPDVKVNAGTYAGCYAT